MAFLTKDQILGADDTRTETVPCPEWGGDVLIVGVSAADRDRYEAAIFAGDKPDHENMRSRLCAMAICGEDRKPLFSPKDVIALGKKSAAALDRCFQAAKRLSGIGVDAVDREKKDSSGDQSEDSLSA